MHLHKTFVQQLACQVLLLDRCFNLVSREIQLFLILLLSRHVFCVDFILLLRQITGCHCSFYINLINVHCKVREKEDRAGEEADLQSLHLYQKKLDPSQMFRV